MPSRVPGKRSCTAWASTCAVECRMTARPSGLAAGTGSTCASACGAQARSIRSPVARSRTTTAPSGPLSEAPAHGATVRPLERDPGRLERVLRRRPGRHPDRGDGGRGGRGGHGDSRRVGDRRRTGPGRVGRDPPSLMRDRPPAGMTPGAPVPAVCPHLPSLCMTVQRSYENAEVGQQLYAILEAVKKPDVLWDKLTTGHYDWLGVRRNGRYVLGRPRLTSVRREDDGPIPDDEQHPHWLEFLGPLQKRPRWEA